jgi:adenylate cyclase class 2
MLEIEIKAYCDNHEEVIQKIIILGGRFKERIIEHDIYFNHPCRDFATTDEALRIRVADRRNILTYKGPKIGEKTKTRFEEEVDFNQLESMKIVLLKLGFTVVDEVVKKREKYYVDDIEICVDEVDALGNFIELEKRGEKKEVVEEELFNLAKELGLYRFETRSYLELKINRA